MYKQVKLCDVLWKNDIRRYDEIYEREASTTFTHRKFQPTYKLIHAT